MNVDPGRLDPIRAELLSADKLVERAKALATAHQVAPGKPPHARLLLRLKENDQFLYSAYQTLNSALDSGKPIPPAAEWLVDNFHVVAEQLRAIRDDLPKHYYRELPALASGEFAGYPRVYAMAVDLIAHTDSHLDGESIKQFIEAYQTVATLTTGELWAMAIMLRLGLLENLRRLIAQAEQGRHARAEADRLADRLLAAPAQSAESLRPLLATDSWVQDGRPLAFTVQLWHRLREGGPNGAAALDWLHEQQAREETSLDELTRRDHQAQATAQVSVGHVIMSLRLLSTMDWAELVEETSQVDAQLRRDPAGFYSRCDFATRDRYRHVVEQIASGSHLSEIEIADEVVAMAHAAWAADGDGRRGHVGYYLIDQGRPEVERRAHFRPGLARTIQRLDAKWPFVFYQVPIALITLTLMLLLSRYGWIHSHSVFSALAIALVGSIPASALALTIENWICTLLVGPVVLPKLDFKDGIPPELRTFVVLPAILADPSEIEEFVSRLEVHYLANSDDVLDFALLLDYPDSDTETQINDENFLTDAKDRVAALNQKYPRSGGPRFHLYHRVRRWNASEGKWMGWERKRGKLEEFNRLLRGDPNTTYVPADVPMGIKYVITLDADTIFPRDAARKLLGTLAHPLNAPVIDECRGRIVAGYGILQPRVSQTLSSANRTWFARIFSGHTGIDPYTTVVSNIYQDLFQEASFIGKGIYDVDAVNACLSQRFPENALLSHDLIESAFARTALVSDVEFFDDSPPDYLTYLARLHRWVRGDWQVARWLWPRVPRADGTSVPNTLSWLNRWKLFDNLRRSLVNPALLLMLLFGWTLFPGAPVFWSVCVYGILFAPVILQFISGLFSCPKDLPWAGHLQGLLADMIPSALQWLLTLSFLPQEVIVLSDAIIRTLFRMVRRRRMLEWTTAAQVARASVRGWPDYARRMAGSQILVALSLLAILWLRPGALWVALPFLLAWAAAPLLAYLVGRPIPHKQRALSPAAVPALRGHAREIWRFFETFVGEDDHWLPPDNFQEVPEPVVAHRTSPTNIGLLLLANVSAWDFGFIGATELVERTERTLATLTQMKTFNGHLYNWYDTRTLAPLNPRYVSTVDSGNLAGALITLRQFAQSMAETWQPTPERFCGVRDTAEKFYSQAKKTSSLSAAQEKAFQTVRRLLDAVPQDPSQQEERLEQLSALISDLKPAPEADSDTQYWWDAARRVVASHLADYARPQDLPRRLQAIAIDADEFVQEMDFRFLFNEERGVFSIGFNATSGQIDGSYYDLLSSEARLAGFVAIVKGDVPQSHWFRMARALASVGRHRALVSWSGSMFEYLMPLLIMHSEPNSLLDETYRAVVRVQQIYAGERGVPWGVSEAAYNARDAAMNYQYGPFGVPGLGLKRGLANDLVLAPYATFLAAMIDLPAALENLDRLQKLGLRGRFGFYEAMDATKERVPPSEPFAVVRAYMAHHQGMSLVALDNILHDDAMQHRFHADPAVQATELLLQERVLPAVRESPLHIVDDRLRVLYLAEPAVPREFDSPMLTPPRTQILSNGSYLTVITTGGSGYSECQGIRITRWREDATRDHWGSFFYLRERPSGMTWSAGFQPTGKVPSAYHVKFSEDRAEFMRRDTAIDTHTDIIVSSEDDAEIRRLTVVNKSALAKEIEVTSYMEIVLTTAAADLAHPAFSNLFIETEFVPGVGILLASRRPRSAEEPTYWAAHVLMCETETVGDLEYETDRRQFIGRARSTLSPQALEDTTPLSNSTGAVLDPIFSLRRRVKIEPNGRAILAFTTLMAKSREEALARAEKYGEARAIAHAFELAATHAQVLLRQLALTPEEAHTFQRIASRLIYSDMSLRPRPSLLARNTRTPSALWAYGISGDLPICLARVEDANDLDIVRQLLRAHEYWRIKGFATDLVILNEYPTSYFQSLQEELQAVIRFSEAQGLLDKPGGVFLRRADLMPEEDKILLQTAARVQIVAQRGTLARQVMRVDRKDILPPPHAPSLQFIADAPAWQPPKADLILDNGFGGFTPDGTEYVIRLKEGMTTPAPWINVISNPQFGFQISEMGAGATWSVNSRENRLTPWFNDAVSDPVDAAVYIRDEDSGQFWSPTPAPARGAGAYEVRHGAGYTRFLYGSYGLEQELLAFVPLDAPVKILKLRLRNRTSRRRSLSVTYFAEWVLGVTRSQSAPFVISAVDDETGALLATNPYNNEFAGRVAFAAINDKKRTVSADRTAFLGPNGNPANPTVLSRAYLGGRVGAGLDPCAALQGKVQLEPGAEHTVILLLGEGKDTAEARALVQRFNHIEEVDRAFEHVKATWDATLKALQVHTPNPEMNLMLNRWLLYQTYACRFLSRSAFYQGGGAYGFRDQLQDAMAFVFSRPDGLREHLLRAASRQFIEGDVQHWWHPPTGRGVRTRISDDLLWLPYATLHYVRATGDKGVLDERVPFLEAPPLKPDEAEAYIQPAVSTQQASLYEHCYRAIDHSLKFGAHGLPLMGSGDWNDGMNRIGVEGRGESVWLGWFQITILRDFAKLCESRDDLGRAAEYRGLADKITQAIETHAWDGAWYKRAFDDEGVPVGSRENAECRIDSIAQSWAILSAAADPTRARQAMESVERWLMLPEENMALLFAPPFIHTPRDPGYIKGYLAGIRENGGQYTHAATWLIAAYAELGDGDRAVQLFHQLNPLAHASTREKAEKYKVEPYVVVGDIYSHPAHLGRGGWSWYTGAAAWLYRVGIEWILGLRLYGNRLAFQPCIPKAWEGYQVTFRWGRSVYEISVENPTLVGRGVKILELDGVRVEGNAIPMDAQAGVHQVRVVLGL